MAQWLGQFSGNNQATRVQDAEAALRHAVTVFLSAGPSETRENKAKAVCSLASRLLSARLRLLKSRIDAAEDKQMRHVAAQTSGVESLRQREATVRAEGLNGILVEFGAQDALA